MCVSVPVLDDDCGVFVCFVYDDGIIDDKLLQGLSLCVHGICNVMSTSSLMSSNMFIISMSTYVVMGCFMRTSFSAIVSLLLLGLTIASVVLGCCVCW